MTNYLPTLGVCALYAAATYLLLAQLRAPADQINGVFAGRRPALWLAAVALVLHTVITFQRSGLPDALTLPLFTAISVTGLIIVLIQLVMCLTRPADFLGLLIYPLAAAGLLASELSGAPARVLSQNLQVHILLSLAAYSVLALGATQAVLVWTQRRYLQNHKPSGFIRALPPLTSMESLLFSLLAAGFILLTMSLLSGFMFLEDMFAQSLVHKTVLACLAWVIFAVLLLGRWRFGWRGKRAVGWTLGGFAILLIAYFGSKLVLELILQR